MSCLAARYYLLSVEKKMCPQLGSVGFSRQKCQRERERERDGSTRRAQGV